MNIKNVPTSRSPQNDNEHIAPNRIGETIWTDLSQAIESSSLIGDMVDAMTTEEDGYKMAVGVEVFTAIMKCCIG